MDHLFQIRSVGEIEEPMLEGMTALGYMAAHTQRARLGLMVGAVHYRQPGLWLKAVTTLDVLSGGRAWFGIGAAWNEEESRALGIPFPELPDRFALLEDTLRMAHGWHRESDGTEASRSSGTARPRRPTAQLPAGAVAGRVCRSWSAAAASGRRCASSPATPTRATCSARPDMLRHKYEVLREHCEDVGRDYDTIEKTNLTTISITPDGANGIAHPGAAGRPPRQLGRGRLAAHHLLGPRRVRTSSKLELIGRDVHARRSAAWASPVADST